MPPEMTPDEMQRIALRLWGDRWVGRMAAHFEVTRRAVERWRDRSRGIPEGVAADLRAMIQIAPPPGSTSAEDRDAACREALEPEMTRIVGMAEAAGWHRAEVAVAILAMVLDDLSDHAGEAATAELLRQALAAVEADPSPL